MHNNNMSGIILEGIAGTGKTSAFSALLKSKVWVEKPYLSSLALTEHQTLRVLEPKRQTGNIRKDDNLSLLSTHVSYLENLQAQLQQTDWLARDRSAQKVPYIIERFHFSHLYHYDYLSWSDVQSVDDRLLKLNALLFLFTVDPEDIQTRIIDDYRKAGWSDYLHTLGSTDHEIKNYFIAKQDRLIQSVAQTKLPTININSSGLATNEIVEQIVSNWGFLKP